MRKLYVFSVLLLLMSLFSCTEKTENPQLKVLVWNIWHGGNDESLPKDGRPSVIEVIKTLEAVFKVLAPGWLQPSARAVTTLTEPSV